MEYPDEAKAMMFRMARTKLRLKLRDFADLMGSSAPTCCQWESGRRIPRGPTWRMFLLLMQQKGIEFDKDGMLVDTPEKAKKKRAA
jgi:DNA-binding transcriptional regulator YiaG